METKGLIDTGSMVTTINEDLFNSFEPKPPLLPLEDFELSITAANGSNITYIGYVELSISVPSIGGGTFDLPILVVPTTENNQDVPCIIGTNLIRLCRTNNTGTEDLRRQPMSDAWETAFDSLVDDSVGTVKSTRRTVIQPNQVKTITGMVRKHQNIEAAVTEPCSAETNASKVSVCPRVVTLANTGKTSRIPVRLCNMTARAIVIPCKTNICELKEVKVLRNVDIKPNQKANVSSTTANDKKSEETKERKTIKEQFGVDIDETQLTSEQKAKVRNLFEKYEQIFPKSKLDLGHTDVVHHKINLMDEKPFKEPYRRVPPALFNEVKEHLKEMLEIGAIRESKSPWSSNVVIVRKKDGTIRFCIDFRKLNQRTVKDAYAIPRVEDTLHLLSGAKYFSKLDLKSGYWQVELEEEDKAKTAFSVGGLGFYECNRMPFGLSNAPATFQRLMERCMGELNLRDCLIYLDDIIIFSDDIDGHLERLDAVFGRLAEYNLKLKPPKCEFFKTKTTYLGHVVSADGIEADPAKTEAVKTWPIPKSVKEVRKFLGFVGYYRRFVKDFSKIARPLNDLLIGHSTVKNVGKKSKPKKRVAFVWGQDQQAAFDKLKETLICPPVLAYADYCQPFKVHTDASLLGLGAVLYQRQEGKDRVIAYASRSLKPAERNYPAHKLECLALKWAVTDKFHDYLYGATFEVVTDNNPLTYVTTTAKLDATVQRWVASLANYNFTPRYRAGKNNADADGLSRIPRNDQPHQQSLIQVLATSASATVEENPLVFSVVDPTTLPEVEMDDFVPPDDLVLSNALSSKDWKIAQLQDPVLSQIHRLVKDGAKLPVKRDFEGVSPLDKFRRDWDKLVLKDGVLYHRGHFCGKDYLQLVLPECLKDDVFRALHDDQGHQGRDRTTSLFKQRFYWPGMDGYIRDKVSSCPRCIRRKSQVSTASLVNISSTAPMEVICLDFLSLERSKGGFEHILVITDHFTRYAQAYPATNQTARTTAKILFERFIVHYGFPSRIHSDQGANFESDLIKELCQLAGMVKSRTTPYHPMGNGMVERFNQTLLKMLGTLEEENKADWKSHVGPLVHAYNVTIHPSTGYSPYYLMFGRPPKLAIDAFLGLNSSDVSSKSQNEYARKLRDRLTDAYKKASETAEKAAEANKVQYDRKARAAEVQIGDLVLVRNVSIRGKHKIADRWEDDPYRVIGKPFPDQPVYEVQLDKPRSRKIRRLHRNLLLPIGQEKTSQKSLNSARKYVIPQRRMSQSSSDDIQPTRRSNRTSRPPERFQSKDWRRR